MALLPAGRVIPENTKGGPATALGAACKTPLIYNRTEPGVYSRGYTVVPLNKYPPKSSVMVTLFKGAVLLLRSVIT